MSEKFSLKWNDFHSNVSGSFSLYRTEEYLHDVTLVSDDQNRVSAHKLVLSASSEYFRNIFKSNPHPNPLLCLDGISVEDLNNIMDYIYNGEVQIYKENLDRFLAIAQRLKLQGLTENIQKERKDEVNNSSYDASMMHHDGEYAVEENETELEQYGAMDNSNLEVKLEEPDEPSTNVDVTNINIQDIKDKINEYIIECDDKSYQCSLCGKMSYKNPKGTQKHALQRHIETHLQGLSYACPICQKEFKTRNSLTYHKSTYHKSKLSIGSQEVKQSPTIPTTPTMNQFTNWNFLEKLQRVRPN